MIKLERSNLQDFCRTCLHHLEAETAPKFVIHETPNLMKILIHCTTLNLNEDADKAFPQLLCTKCYEKLQEFQHFRDMALQSNEILREIVKNENGVVIDPNDSNTHQEKCKIEIKSEATSDEEFLDIFKAEETEMTSSFLVYNIEEANVSSACLNNTKHNIETFDDVNTASFDAPNRVADFEKASTSEHAIKRKLYVDDTDSEVEAKKDHINSNTKENSCKNCHTLKGLILHQFEKTANSINELKVQNQAIIEAIATEKVLSENILREESNNRSIRTVFPLNNSAAISQLNETIDEDNLGTYITTMKSLLKGKLAKTITQIFSTDLIIDINLDGTHGKKRLKDFQKFYDSLMGTDSVAVEDDLVTQLFYFTTNLDEKKNRLEQLQRTRQEQLRNILSGINKRNEIFLSLMKQKIPKKLWVVERYGAFWEEDVPHNDAAFFKENFRMERKTFEILCKKLNHLTRKDTNFKNCIPLDKRIAIALYTLSSSSDNSSIGRLFGVSKPIVCQILSEFCQQVWEVLAPEYLSGRICTQEKIEECTEGFKKIGFPQCFGALDGCHIEVRPSTAEAVDYYNCKGWYSMVLLALVDYRCKFLYINVGAPGRCNDSQIFDQSMLKKSLQSPLFKQNAKVINGVNVPVLILGDASFRFAEFLMKPYPFSTAAKANGTLFNYRLSKTRSVVKNAFEQLNARFRRIGKGIDNNIKNAASIIKCCCVLHNFVTEHNDIVNSEWIQNHKRFEHRSERIQPEFTDTFTDHNAEAEKIRNAIAMYLGLQQEE